MLPAWEVVAQQRWWLVQVHGKNVNIAIVVEIAERATAAAVACDSARTSLGRNLFETSVSKTAEDDARPAIRLVWSSLHLRINSASNPENVRGAIIVQVFDADTPADETGFAAEPGAQCCIGKLAFPVVGVHGWRICCEVRLHDIQGAIASQIADTDAHSGLLHSVFAQGYSAFHAFFRERTIVLVSKQKTRGGITSDIDIGPAVVIKVRRYHGETVSRAHLADSCRGAHVTKRAVPIVGVQRVAAIRKPARSAKHLLNIATGEFARPRHRFRIE